MKIFDNISEIVRDDMADTIKKGSKVSVAAACFSMYAYKELKKQLEGVENFRFIFTSPTFTTEKASKEKREFYIPRLNRESSLYGTEFEIKLRNEMTQKSIAKECADWIRRKAVFKSNITGENMQGFMTVDSSAEQVAYMPMAGFTTVDIGCERGNNSYNMTNRMEAPFSTQYMQLFETIWNDRSKMQDVTDVVIENISSAYNENSPEFIYFMTLHHVFSEFLDDISEDVLPNEATGFKESKIWNLLYDFQRDAVLAIINKLEKYNGCILADSVGLGKTFTALAVVKYYENRNKSVLVLCPKKLAENWNTYKGNYVNNPIVADRLRYDVLFHTDLSRTGGISNGIDLDRLNWGNYDLVVIDDVPGWGRAGLLGIFGQVLFNARRAVDPVEHDRGIYAHRCREYQHQRHQHHGHALAGAFLFPAVTVAGGPPPAGAAVDVAVYIVIAVNRLALPAVFSIISHDTLSILFHIPSAAAAYSPQNSSRIPSLGLAAQVFIFYCLARNKSIFRPLLK